MAPRMNQREHDRIIKEVVEILKNRGYNDVRADLDGNERPKRIEWKSTGEGFLPDVSGHKDWFRIFEVETEDSIDDDHTESQWKLFAAYAKANDAMFYVVFPNGCVEKVKNRLEELQIEAYLWEM